MKPKRDNVYYAGLLRRQNPTIYAEFRAGKFATLAKALQKAGIKKAPTALGVLKREWKRATPKEKSEFQTFVGGITPPAITVPTPLPRLSAGSLLDIAGLLHPDVVDRIRMIMNKRGLSPADVCVELGFKRLDYRWRGVYDRRNKPLPGFLSALPHWLATNSKS